MNALIESRSRAQRERDGVQFCRGCSRHLFSVHTEKGVVFVEIKCGSCNNFVIRKFKAYEKK